MRQALLLLAAGCGGPSDRVLYDQAAVASDEEASALCERIGKPGLRGECLVFSASRLALIDADAALARCEALPQGTWRDECAFLSMDAAGLVGRDAVRFCDRAGAFVHECLVHAIDRDVRSQAELPTAYGEEVELNAALDALLAPYEESEHGEWKRRPVRTYLARLILDRWADRDFDPSLCGAANEGACFLAFRMSGLMRVADLQALCDGPLTEEAVVAAGGAGWTDAAAEFAEQGWRESCDEVHASGQRGPTLIPLATPTSWDGQRAWEPPSRPIQRFAHRAPR